MSRHCWHGGPLCCLVLAIGVVLAPSAATAADELSLSRDGRTWAPSLDIALFEESMRWVPGDLESARFYVRGSGRTSGDLIVEAITSPSDRLVSTGDLRISARGGGGVWTPVDQAGTHRLLSTPNIPDGDVVPVTVTVSFAADSTNVSQLRSAELRFRVTLTESQPAGVDQRRGESGGGLLPDTGGPAFWLAVAGGLVAGAGSVIVSRHGRRRTVSSHG